MWGMSDFALPYLDEIAVFSNSRVENLEHLRQVFQRSSEAGLTVKARKCELGGAEVSYLGHVVGRGNHRPSEIKVEAVASYPRLKTKTDVRRAFLGLTGYYRRYIKNYSEMASPLTDALRKDKLTQIGWDEKQHKAFQSLEALLIGRPVLEAPDYNRPFIVQCDASHCGMGVVLCQRDKEGNEHPIVYMSRKLTIHEEAYSASEKESVGRTQVSLLPSWFVFLF